MVQFLSTKFFIPQTRPELVERQRLIKQLNQGTYRKLTLLSAPAGFGKTTLVSEWISRDKIPAAWISLDKGDDSNIFCFLGFIISSLQHVSKQIGAETLSMLQVSKPPPPETVLTSLINEIASYPERLVLVLDDYHYIESQLVHDALAFLLDNLPPRLHVVVTTREDPPLRLSSLRARDQLTELRVADLRFTPDEAATFLNQVMGLNLTVDQIASLENRTEGWIAGLQLAAISMRGREDISGFINAFAGDNRYIVDYLVEEVLHSQPEAVRRFLLRSSILDQLNGSICDAVTGQEDSKALLETLERTNLFVVPLDDKRQWFRYHHLFAEVLFAHLLEEESELLPVLHQRASMWFERNNRQDKAIRHAIASNDFERTAGLLELEWPSMEKNFQVDAWLRWARKLPADLFRIRPVLSVGYSWALLNIGELDVVDQYLNSAENWLEQENSQSGGAIVIDERQFAELPVKIATARAYLAQANGDVDGTIKYGQQAIDLIPESDYLQRGIVGALLGLAYWASGDLEEAFKVFAAGMADMRSAGNVLYAIRGTYSLADIRLAQGRLREAVRIFEQSLRLAEDEGEHVLRGAADLYLRLSELYLENGDREKAEEYILRGEDLGDPSASPHWAYRLSLARARVLRAQGDFDGALELLGQAEQRYVRTPVPEVHPHAALKARIRIAQGKLAEALDWVREQRLTPLDELNFLREYEHITLARLLIARHQEEGIERSLDEAHDLLSRLLIAAESGRRAGSVLEILILKSLACKFRGDMPKALDFLGQALALAEPEGYFQIFINEGTPMESLLSEIQVRGDFQNYTNRLLAGFASRRQADASMPISVSSQPLIEPLTERELEILALIAQGLSNSEISDRLFLALSTIKGHNRNIYSKLQVSRRTEAVARAQELGLL